MHNICVVTGTRAEYGLLYWLLKEIETSNDFMLQLVVTGMHLSSEFGLTYKKIEQDDFTIDRKVEMLLSADTDSAVTKSIGLGLIGFADCFAELKPDLIVLLGDRFEIFSAATAATVAKIPIAHIHGGETTEGAYDESFRHSITKMSHLHFTTTETYRKRVIQLGESPDRVFNVGAPGIDNIKNLKLLARDEFENSIGFRLEKRNLLITYHPVTLEVSTAEEQFRNVLLALDTLDETGLIFTKANADSGGRIINKMIDDYVARNHGKAVAFASMGQLRYLSAMQYVDAVVGNSSSGLLEAPSFHIGTLNIGDRQLGRVRADSVIDCGYSKQAILDGLQKLYSENFQSALKHVKNPHGDGDVASKILTKIRERSLEGMLKKAFHDIQW